MSRFHKFLSNLRRAADGDAANSDSDGDPAAHNTDAFDVSGSTDLTIVGATVYNQDVNSDS